MIFSQPFPHVVPIPLQQQFCVRDLSLSSLSKVYSVSCHRNKTSFCTRISLVFIIIKLYNQSFKNNRQKWVWEQIALTLVSTQLNLWHQKSLRGPLLPEYLERRGHLWAYRGNSIH